MASSTKVSRSLISFRCMFLMIIFNGMIPYATSRKLTSGKSMSQKLTSGKSTPIDIANKLKINLDSIKTDSNPTSHLTSMLLRDLIHPRTEGEKVKRHNRRRRSTCPKKLGGFCVNGGTCAWIIDIDRAYCKCTSNWEGVRCQVPRIKLTSGENPGEKDDNLSIMIAAVLATSAMLFIILMICVCWRRCKSIRKQLQKDDVELEKKHMLIENQSVSSFSSSGNLR